MIVIVSCNFSPVLSEALDGLVHNKYYNTHIHSQTTWKMFGVFQGVSKLGNYPEKQSKPMKIGTKLVMWFENVLLNLGSKAEQTIVALSTLNYRFKIGRR